MLMALPFLQVLLISTRITTNKIIAAVVVLVILGAGYWFLSRRSAAR